MTIYTKTLIMTTLLLVSTSQIQASKKSQNKGERQRPAFSSLDINSDGVVDLEEFSSHKIPHGDHQNIFSNIDSDGNGKISEEEFKNHTPPRPPKRRGE